MRIDNGMTLGIPNPRQLMSPLLADALDAPLLYLSSDQAGWEGVAAEAFLEPTQLQGWKAPAGPDVKLILFAGGPLQLDTRYENDPRAKRVVRGGELVLTPAVEPYEVGWKSLSSAPTRTLHLRLNRNLLLRTAEELDGCDPARVFLPRRAGFRDAMLREIAFTLWRELEQSTPAGKLYAQAAAQMLAVHLLRHYTSAPIKNKEVSQLLTHRQVRRVTDFVVADLGQDLTLEAMAEQVGFSPYHFARLFRQTTGESPHQFVLRQRLEKAQHLLRETKIPLASVALESGFANQSHLTRIFKRYLGLTPKAYRLKS